ncbi:PPC domain-containing protein [Gymnodinialimonas hymeniacidonis]|uniref:PPC domain-containing protein n=1 Tax=Gymnodinialimonas hymeniacidonis TaxID=3126508 RepID=UPI0034C66E97
MKFTLSALATTATLALTAGMAQAQEVSCGGIGVTGQWIGGSAEASDISTSEGPLLQSNVPIAFDANVISLFSVSEAGDVRLEAQPVGSGDSVIEIYDEAGTLVITDDDGGGGWASRAETVLQPGNYCMLTRGFAGGQLSSDIQISRLEHDAITSGLTGGFFGGGGGSLFVGVDPCTNETAATPLGTGPLDGDLANGGVSAVNTINGAPYYRFTLNSPQTISVRAENPNADPYIYVFDGNGTLIGENDDAQIGGTWSLNSRLDFTQPLQAGTYCIGMRALSNPDVPVTVSVLAYSQADALAELYATGEAAPPMDGSFPIVDLGVLPGRSVRDAQISGTQATWFSMDVPEAGALVINAVEVTDSDPLIILYNDLGQEIAYNDDSNGTLNSEIVARVNAGRYLLAVRQYSDGYQGIIRIATERYVPAQ